MKAGLNISKSGTRFGPETRLRFLKAAEVRVVKWHFCPPYAVGSGRNIGVSSVERNVASHHVYRGGYGHRGVPLLAVLVTPRRPSMAGRAGQVVVWQRLSPHGAPNDPLLSPARLPVPPLPLGKTAPEIYHHQTF